MMNRKSKIKFASWILALGLAVINIGNLGWAEDSIEGMEGEGADTESLVVDSSDIIQASEDTTAPEYFSVSVDKKVVTSGDEVKVSIEARDQGGGIGLIEFNYENNNNNTYLRCEEVTYNRNTEKYEGVLKINWTSIQGTYKLKNITIIDKAGNRLIVFREPSPGLGTVIIRDLSQGDFQVKDTLALHKDAIKSIEISNNKPIPGEKIKLSVSTISTDNVAYLKANYISVDQTEGSYRTFKLDFNPTNNKYEGDLLIDGNMDGTGWKISDIYFFNEENKEILNITEAYGGYEILQKGYFDTLSEEVNTMNLEGINVDRNSVTLGETVNISAKVSNSNSIVKSGTVEYILPSGESNIIYLSESGDTLKGIFSVERYTSPGLWKVNKVTLTDGNGGRKVIYNSNLNSEKDGMNMGTGNINIYGTTWDKEVPEIINATIDKSEATLGESIKISIFTKDRISGIKSLNMILYDDEGGIRPSDIRGVYLQPKYNEASNSYDFIIDTSNPEAYNLKTWISTKGGWRISKLDIEDNAGNVYSTNRWSNDILYNINFFVYPREVGIWEDFNKDGIVNNHDLDIISRNYNKVKHDIDWNDTYDLNGDYIIDLFDLVKVSSKIK